MRLHKTLSFALFLSCALPALAKDSDEPVLSDLETAYKYVMTGARVCEGPLGIEPLNQAEADLRADLVTLGRSEEDAQATAAMVRERSDRRTYLNWGDMPMSDRIRVCNDSLADFRGDLALERTAAGLTN